MSQNDIRSLAETLGAVVLSNPSEEQRKKFQLYLEHAKRARVVESVIDFPLQRYNGRTLLHLVADNGLWEYLEELLKNGGTAVFLLSVVNCRERSSARVAVVDYYCEFSSPR